LRRERFERTGGLFLALTGPLWNGASEGLVGLRSVEAEHGGECFVDAPHLFGGHVAHQVGEPLGVDGADLFDEDAGPLPGDVDLGPERRRPGAAGGGGHDHHRARQELVGLDDDCEALAVLLVADAFREAEAVHVTPQHEALP